MTTTGQVLAILARLRREMNGAVSAAMKERGISYNLNYGVSIPTIKEVAGQYAPNHQLAEALWRQDVRELKLAAVFIEDPAQMTPAQMEQWMDGSQTSELVEQMSMTLLWKVPGALKKSIEWINAGNYTTKGKESSEQVDKRRTAAFYIAGKLAGKINGTENEKPFAPFIDSLFRGVPGETSALFAIREIYKHYPSLRPEINNVLKEYACDPSGAEFADELQWQLDYITDSEKTGTKIPE